MHNFAILYVEDEENDVLFLQRAFRAAGVTNPMKVVIDGQQAVEYLAGTGRFANREQFPMPGLILLDLKLPGRTGFEVLKWIRESSKLKRLPVVIYTSSSQPRDIGTAYDLGANGYLVKQGNPTELADIVRSVRDFWMIHNEPPPLLCD